MRSTLIFIFILSLAMVRMADQSAANHSRQIMCTFNGRLRPLNIIKHHMYRIKSEYQQSDKKPNTMKHCMSLYQLNLLPSKWNLKSTTPIAITTKNHTNYEPNPHCRYPKLKTPITYRGHHHQNPSHGYRHGVFQYVLNTCQHPKKKKKPSTRHCPFFVLSSGKNSATLSPIPCHRKRNPKSKISTPITTTVERLSIITDIGCCIMCQTLLKGQDNLIKQCDTVIVCGCTSFISSCVSFLLIDVKNSLFLSLFLCF